MKILIRGFFRFVRLLLAPVMLAWLHAPVSGRVRRDPAAQAALDARTGNLVLYHFPTCPFCIRVRRNLRRLGLEVAERDARNDETARAELEAGGGKVQVPCLRITHDDGHVEWLYESDAINAWLERLAGE